MKVFIFCSMIIYLISEAGLSCTTFFLEHNSQPVFGRNFDWRVGDGLLIINKRGVVKSTISDRSGSSDQHLTWKSKYGSATFNHFGREFPLGGMNEVGLVVETLMLDETEYPEPDSRPEIEISQWIQYQLDNFSTIEEVIASDSNIRIKRTKGYKYHFLICDRTRNCTTIEFLKGNLVYHTKENMPVKTLTNSPYTKSIDYWKKDLVPKPDENQSIERFINAANMVKTYRLKSTPKKLIKYAFDILQYVEHDSFTTQWSIVYDMANLGIHFHTDSNKSIRYFSLKSFDFSCMTPVKVLDLDADITGDVTEKFNDYTHKINRNLIRYVFFETYFYFPPDHILDMLSKYPESTSCIE